MWLKEGAQHQDSDHSVLLSALSLLVELAEGHLTSSPLKTLSSTFG